MLKKQGNGSIAMEKIYTTFFDNIHKLSDDIIPISICLKQPDWWDGLEYKKLAPKKEFFLKWRETKDEAYYTRCFYAEVISQLDANVVVAELQEFASTYKKIALVCYEDPHQFCHRALIAQWLRINGFEVEEYEN